MQIFVTVSVSADDEWTMTSEEAAHAVLDALGGDATKDACTLQASLPPAIVGPSVAPMPTPAPPEMQPR